MITTGLPSKRLYAPWTRQRGANAPTMPFAGAGEFTGAFFRLAAAPPSHRGKTRQRAFLAQQDLPFPLAPAPTLSTPQQTPASPLGKVSRSSAPFGGTF